MGGIRNGKIGRYTGMAMAAFMNSFAPPRYQNRINTGRGRAKAYGFGKSWSRPHQGNQECARRLAQGVNGTQYVHGAQYPSMCSVKRKRKGKWYD